MLLAVKMTVDSILWKKGFIVLPRCVGGQMHSMAGIDSVVQ